MTAVTFGRGCLRAVSDIMERHRVRDVFLVAGRRSFQDSGASERLRPCLHGKNIYRFSDFTQNPKIGDVVRGVAELKGRRCDMVMAVGGGSALDMAKLVNIVAHNDLSVTDAVNGIRAPARKGRPLLAVPTTSGSGSEATHFAVVYIENTKHSLAHPYLLPDYAVIDPSLTDSMDGRLTAVTGFDALCQAVESYWAISSTETSRALASRAIGLLLSALSRTVHRPDARSRDSMSRGAHLAGRAINTTKTTAPHAVSYPLTIIHGIPHGQAVAAMLGNFFAVHSAPPRGAVCDPRGGKFLSAIIDDLCRMFGCRSPGDFPAMWYGLMDDAGLAYDMRALGVGTRADVDRIVANVSAERLGNNPVTISAAMFRQVLGVAA